MKIFGNNAALEQGRFFMLNDGKKSLFLLVLVEVSVLGSIWWLRDGLKLVYKFAKIFLKLNFLRKVWKLLKFMPLNQQKFLTFEI